MAGVLYIVATPIGNLEDITFRALRILKEVDLIAAEDTRHSRRLLDHYGIKTPLTSYHEHNEQSKAPHLVERLQRGENVALISDAGTPVLSDPGHRLVQEAIRTGIAVSPVPGPSALVAALSASGLSMGAFAFEGFLPAKKKERREKLQSLCAEARTLVFYEAPHRLKKSLADIGMIFGSREMVLAREMSKVHEEFLRGPAGDLMAQLADREVRGELTLVIAGATAEPTGAEEIMAEIRKLKSDGMRVKEIAALLGEKYSVAKREVYRMVLELEEFG
ncbi:MAG: 16S rRNA (cytidine(1402)-2'-O)-methyltransferase [Alphaproteobacteria bacterium]